LYTQWQQTTMIQSFDTLLNKFKAYLAANPFEKEPVGLYQPVDYILNLGGKRIRPVLLLMAGNLFTDKIEHSLPAAYAIEIFHCFSLVHDDIMDAAPLRRGKPAVHVKYGSNSGILSGDVMLIHAYGYLLKSTRHMEDPRAVLDIFNRVAIEVCEGQQMDMDFETRDDVSIPEYLKMIELKTSVLIGGALEVGALISGASDTDARLLADFGKNIGLAFQLQDDILDTFGDSASFGKKIGGDIAQNKKTYLYLKARDRADATTLATLDRLYANDTKTEESEKIKTVTDIFTKLAIQEDTERLKEDYLSQAFKALDSLSVSKDRKEHLVALSNKLMGRKV